MTTLVVGASGATGRLLVEQLFDRGQWVRAIVRSPDKLSAVLREHESLTVIAASVLELSDDDLSRHLGGCDAVASCLGHHMSLKGIYGQPRRLVMKATRRLYRATEANDPHRPVMFVLMNTAGNRNRDLDEPLSLGHRCVIALLRRLVPPHADNEDAADFLRTQIGQEHPRLEWAVVRPDTLTDEDSVSACHVHPSPTRSAIFDPGRTSRINVAHFMAELITEDAVWEKWKGKMPVIYNEPGTDGGTADSLLPALASETALRGSS